MNTRHLLFCASLLFFNLACSKKEKVNCLDNPCEGKSEIEWGGHRYALVEIGCQCWFAENLRYSVNIPEITNDTAWSESRSAAWCYYDNDSSNEALYGKIYNWFALSEFRVCPPGYSIPTYVDSEELMDYLGGQYLAGGKLKAVDYWNAPNDGATNASGFNAYPAGSRSVMGFHRIGNYTAFWNNEETGLGLMRAFAFGLEYRHEYFEISHSHKSTGYSCRCLKK